MNWEKCKFGGGGPLGPCEPARCVLWVDEPPLRFVGHAVYTPQLIQRCGPNNLSSLQPQECLTNNPCGRQTLQKDSEH